MSGGITLAAGGATICLMALRFLEGRLRRALAGQGREELADVAVGSVGFTDDGGTIYVHIHPAEGWPGRAQGRAYVLAWEDYAPTGSDINYCYRWLVREAKRAMDENVDEIIRWLEGR